MVQLIGMAQVLHRNVFINFNSTMVQLIAAIYLLPMAYDEVFQFYYGSINR